MEQVRGGKWPFDVTPATIVVTSLYVTRDSLLIDYVTHEYDEEEGYIWQFHHENNDYRPEVLLLVRIDEILQLDPSLMAVASLPVGYAARRQDRNSEWTIEQE